MIQTAYTKSCQPQKRPWHHRSGLGLSVWQDPCGRIQNENEHSTIQFGRQALAHGRRISGIPWPWEDIPAYMCIINTVRYNNGTKGRLEPVFRQHEHNRDRPIPRPAALVVDRSWAGRRVLSEAVGCCPVRCPDLSYPWDPQGVLVGSGEVQEQGQLSLGPAWLVSGGSGRGGVREKGPVFPPIHESCPPSDQLLGPGPSPDRSKRIRGLKGSLGGDPPLCSAIQGRQASAVAEVRAADEGGEDEDTDRPAQSSFGVPAFAGYCASRISGRMSPRV